MVRLEESVCKRVTSAVKNLQFAVLVDSILVRLLHSIIDLHNGCLISTPVAIVRGRKDSYNALIVLPLVSFHAKLMRPGNKMQSIDMSKLFSYMSCPKVYPAPRGEIPQPQRSSGSDQTKSHMGPS